MSDSKTEIEASQTFDVPKQCKAGVVVNEGPDFHVEVRDVDVPEPGLYPSAWTFSFTRCMLMLAFSLSQAQTKS